jgi:uncharacterized protein with GYD domain
MTTYVSLINWTDKGIKEYRDTVARANASSGLAAKFGGRIVSIWWTIGPYDLVAVTEFPDEESATAFALALGAVGNVRTTTMRAFEADAMSAIVARTV